MLYLIHIMGHITAKKFQHFTIASYVCNCMIYNHSNVSGLCPLANIAI